MTLNSPTVRILSGLLLGIALGAALTAGHVAFADPLVAGCETIGGVWLDSLRMTIIPLVFSLLVVGVAQTAGAAQAGGLTGRALLAFAVLLLLSTTVAAIATPALLQAWPVPEAAAKALRAGAIGGAAKVPAMSPIAEWVKSFVPANPIKAAEDGAMVSIVIFALAFGLAASRMDATRRASVFGFFDAVQAAMLVMVDWVLWAAPFGVFFLAVTVGARTGFAAVGVLGQYVVVVSIMCLLAGVIGFIVGVLGGRVRPGRLVSAMIPVEAMAISTQSSLACTPLMLEACEKIGVPEAVRGLILPMAVALFRITSPAGNLAVVIYVAHIYGVSLGPAQLAAGTVVAALVSLGAVGVASSITFFTTLVPISMAMGVPMDLLPLLLAVETLPDFSRTIGNVAAHVGVTALAGRWTKAEQSSATIEAAAG